ncbi:MAG: AMP-binding protein [Flaviflexus sp.]|nr:AMP-binding protein [Flaviflexus sp.]
MIRLTGGVGTPEIRAFAEAAHTSLAGGGEPILLDAPGTRGPAPGQIRADTAVLIRTSGSTSAGKLVEITWDQIRASTAATHEALGGEGPWLTCLPIEHIAGAQTVLRSVLAGTEPIPFRLGDSVPTGAYLSLVPTQLRRALADPAVTDSLTAARAILVGGQACPAELLERGRAAGLTLVTTYGMTETCGGCVYDGTPIGSAHITLADSRIIITGPQVASGYCGGEDFAGRLETNDAGRWEGGRLTVLGRLDDAITTGGLTIMPAAVENHLAAAGIHAVAFGVPHPEWGQALVILTEKCEDKERIRPLARQLGPEFSPKGVACLADFALSAFPTLASGKLNRRKLPEMWRVHGEHF